MSHIYIIKNTITQDIYVGKTIKSIDERMKKHLYNMKLGKTHLYRSMRKYGKENFIIESLEQIHDDNLLNERECYYIENLKPKYNMTKGGDGGCLIIISEETRKKLRENSKGKNNSMYGKKGKDNPNYGKKYGKRPKISEMKKNPCVCEGNYFDSITHAEEYYKGKCSVRKRLDNSKYPDWYRLVPKRKYSCKNNDV